MRLRDLLAFAAPYRTQLVLLALLSIAGSLVTLAISALGARLLGGLFETNGTANAASTSLIAAFLAGTDFLVALVGFATAWFSGQTSARLLADLRLHIYRHVQALPMDYHDNHR